MRYAGRFRDFLHDFFLRMQARHINTNLDPDFEDWLESYSSDYSNGIPNPHVQPAETSNNHLMQAGNSSLMPAHQIDFDQRNVHMNSLETRSQLGPFQGQMPRRPSNSAWSESRLSSAQRNFLSNNSVGAVSPESEERTEPSGMALGNFPGSTNSKVETRYESKRAHLERKSQDNLRYNHKLSSLFKELNSLINLYEGRKRRSKPQMLEAAIRIMGGLLKSNEES